MGSEQVFPEALREFYEVQEWRNACAVLFVAHPQEWGELLDVLTRFRLLRTDVGELGTKGGGKSLVAIRIDRMFRDRGCGPRLLSKVGHIRESLPRGSAPSSGGVKTSRLEGR